MNNIFAKLTARERALRIKKSQPSFIIPMLATLTNTYFSSKEWIYETKFDGERCIAIKKNGQVRLMSRNKREINLEYPELVNALREQSADNFIIDGEIVTLNKQGISDFQLLQARINLHSISAVQEKQSLLPIEYNIFDIMYADGYDLCNLPLLSRKTILKELLHYNKILLYTEHRSPNGVAYYKEACHLHMEGIIAKKSDSLYMHTRSPYWLKFKCAMEQELVIGGYTDPQGSRTDFGALLVGYYTKHKEFIFAGKVGSGYSHAVLAMLGKKLRKILRKTCPFTHYDGPTQGIHWVEPQIVAEFKFAEWTDSGKLRVPRYKGLRDDKKAQDVVQELPVSKVNHARNSRS